METPLRGRTILVTGSSMGIGYHVAQQFAQAGADLILAARSKEKLNQLKENLAWAGNKTLVIPCDLTQPDQVSRLCEKIQAEKKLDGIIHNAGMGLYGEFTSLPEQEISRLFELNFFSILKMTQTLLPLLKKSDQGRLVMISSIVSWRSIPRLSPYCATKAALNLFTEALRMELADTSIKVVNVYPGRTRTDFTKNAPTTGWRPFSSETGGDPPEKVAKKILRAYLKGKRDEYVNWGNRMLIWFNFLFPKVIDWGLERYFRGR